jgi:hypothetical protein
MTYKMDVIKTKNNSRYTVIDDRVLFLEARVTELEEVIQIIMCNLKPLMPEADFTTEQDKARARLHEKLIKAFDVSAREKPND